MTNERACATDEFCPAYADPYAGLHKHLELADKFKSAPATGLPEIQGAAITLHGLSEALFHLMNEGACENGQFALAAEIRDGMGRLADDLEKHLSSRAAVSVALPSVATAKTDQADDTPILRLFRQHRAILDAGAAHVSTLSGDELDNEVERLFSQPAEQIEAQIMALPSTCAADFAAKMIVDSCGANMASDWEAGAVWIEARQLVGEQLA